MLAAELLVRCLIEENVRVVFGVPGAQPLGILDAIHRLGRPAGLDFVATRHEQAAAHMADTCARLTGRAGVCLATVGPGAVNLVPGVYEAFSNSIPLIVLTAQNQTWRSYPDHGATQGCDHAALFRPITKWGAVVSHPSRVAALVREAFREALSGRPGPVHLDLPVDVMAAEVDENDARALAPSRYRPTAGPAGEPALVREAAAMLARAERPLIHAGGGAIRAGAMRDIVRLAERLGAAMTTSPAGRGALPEDHPQYLLTGGHGSMAARAESDVVLVLGSRLGALDFYGRAPLWGAPDDQKVIQVDASPSSLAENREIDVGILGDVASVTAQLLAELGDVRRPPHAKLAEYRAAESDWLRELESLCSSEAAPIHPLRLVREARDFFPRDAIVVVDGGNTAVWAHYLARVSPPGAYVWAGDSGMGGGGLPKAIAAKLVRPDRPVYAICGDGFFAMNIQELETAARLKTPIVVLVCNDRAYGMIKAGQIAGFGGRTIGVDFADVRYDEMARAAGWHGERVEDPAAIAPALKRAAQAGRPALLDVIVDAKANLAPPDLDMLVSIWLEGVTLPGR